MDRQRTADHAGGSNENVVWRDAHVSCDYRSSHSGGSQSVRARAGVRVAAVDENGPSDSLAQVQAIDNDRCCDHLVASEDAGDGAALFGCDRLPGSLVVR